MSVESFGQLSNGALVDSVEISGGGLHARFLTWGAVLQDLRLAGHDDSLVLGLPDMASYQTYSRYFGATAGRYANRIANGRATIDGVEFQFDRNFRDRHLLHGGADGTGKQLWDLVAHDSRSAKFQIVLEDGHMGFPGRMSVSALFSLFDEGVLDIRYRAETDKPTLCNLAHHSYFSLDGSGDILDHRLQVLAEHYIPVDSDLIPTGEVAPVARTQFDFRQPRSIRRVDGSGPMIDHNYCTGQGRQSIRKVAQLTSPVSGVSLDVSTTEPGLQVYDGALLDCPMINMKNYAGIALEPQVWPDSPNHAHFAQAILRPGEIYSQHTRYEFKKPG